MTRAKGPGSGRALLWLWQVSGRFITATSCGKRNTSRSSSGVGLVESQPDASVIISKSFFTASKKESPPSAPPPQLGGVVPGLSGVVSRKTEQFSERRLSGRIQMSALTVKRSKR